MRRAQQLRRDAARPYGSGGHQGVDIGATLGQEVYAVEDGVLYPAAHRSRLGAAGNGWSLIGNSDTQYRYYHLSAFAPGLAVGDTVRQGDVIGYVGDTGNATPAATTCTSSCGRDRPYKHAGRPGPAAGDPPQLHGLPEAVTPPSRSRLESRGRRRT